MSEDNDDLEGMDPSQIKVFGQKIFEISGNEVFLAWGASEYFGQTIRKVRFKVNTDIDLSSIEKELSGINGNMASLIREAERTNESLREILRVLERIPSMASIIVSIVMFLALNALLTKLWAFWG